MIRRYCILYHLKSVDSSGLHDNFGKIQDNFDPDGRLDSIALGAIEASCLRNRNYLEFFKISAKTNETTHTLSVLKCSFLPKAAFHRIGGSIEGSNSILTGKCFSQAFVQLRGLSIEPLHCAFLAMSTQSLAD